MLALKKQVCPEFRDAVSSEASRDLGVASFSLPLSKEDK